MEEQQEKNKNRKNISEEKEDIQVKDNTPREIVQKEDINYYFQNHFLINLYQKLI